MRKVRWIHISDLHINNNSEVETRLMRMKLPIYIQNLGQQFDYIFCSGDLKDWDGSYTEDMYNYFLQICDAAKVDLDNLFIVPGNHDVDISDPKRNEIISKITDYNSKYYDPAIGSFKSEDLSVLQSGEKEYLTFIEKLLGSHRIKKAHLVHLIESRKDLNILLVDSTLSYGKDRVRDFVIGTQYLLDALEKCDLSKPTILLTHYSFDFLSQDERSEVELLISTFNVDLWLAGHEHENLIRVQRDKFIECQSGNVSYQYGTTSCFLVGEIDLDSGTGIIRAHAWYKSKGWGVFPHVRIGTNDDATYPFKLRSIKVEGDQKSLNTTSSLLLYNDKQDQIIEVGGGENSVNRLLSCVSLTFIPSSPILYGRDSDIANIKRILKDYYVVCIKADGGEGKSIIACEIINSYKYSIESQEKSSFKHVAWIKYSGDLEKDILELNICENNSGHDFSPQNAYDFIIWLSKEDNSTLLVIDGVSQPFSNKELEMLHAISGQTRVIVTSRCNQDGLQEYVLKKISSVSAVQLFYHKYLNQREVAIDFLKSREDYDNALQLIRIADNNAYLIELLAKTAFSKQLSLAEFINKYAGEISYESIKSLSTKMECGYVDKVKTDNNAKLIFDFSLMPGKCKALMSFFAEFKPESRFFKSFIEWFGFEQDELDWLENQGLIIEDEDNYYLHQMFWDLVYDKTIWKYDIALAICEKTSVIDNLINTKSYISKSLEYPKVQERLFLMEQVCQKLLLAEIVSEKVALLLNSIAIAHYIYGSYYKAIDLWEASASTYSEIFGPIHPSVVYICGNLAVVYRSLDNKEKALEYYDNSIGYLRQNKNASPLLIGALYSNMACLYNDLDQFGKALECLNEASALFDNIREGESLRKSSLYLNYMITYLKIGEVKRAWDCGRRAIDIRRKILGDNHPDTAIAYLQAGDYYRIIGEYSVACGYYNNALPTLQKWMGEKHPDTSSVYYGLGMCAYMNNDCFSTEEYMKKALYGYEYVFGKYHIKILDIYCVLADSFYSHKDEKKAIYYYETATELAVKYEEDAKTSIVLMGKVAEIYYEIGDYNKGLEKYLDILDVYEKQGVKANYGIKEVLVNIARIYLELKDYNLSLQYYERALRSITDGDNDFQNETAIINNNIGAIYHELYEYPQSIKYYKISLNLYKGLNNRNLLSEAGVLYNLGNVYSDQKHFKKAIDTYKKALLIREKILGNDHVDVALILHCLGFVYYSYGDLGKAKEYYQKALGIRITKLDKNDPETAKTYHNLGKVFYDQGLYEKALECFLNSLDILKNSLGEYHNDTGMLYIKIAETYWNIGEIEKAIHYNYKALKICETLIGSSDPNTALLRIRLADLLSEKGDYKNALINYEKALLILKKCPDIQLFIIKNVEDRIKDISEKNNSSVP